MSRKKVGFGLAILCISAVLVRAWHLDWGLPEVYEEAKPLQIARGFWGDPPLSIQLKPNSYLIPSLSPLVLFVEQSLRYFGGSLVGRVESLNDFRQVLDQGVERSVLHARWLHALLSSLVIWPVFLLGKRLVGTSAAWLAAVGVVFVPQAVQAGRMVSTDALLLLFAALGLLHATAVAQEGKRSSYLWCALFTGCASTAHYSGAALLAAYVAAHAVSVRRRKDTPLGAVVHLPFWEGVAVFGFVVVLTMPYAFLDTRGFLVGLGQARAQLGFDRLGLEGVSLWGRLTGFLKASWTIPLSLAAMAGLAAQLLRRTSRKDWIPGGVLFLFVLGTLIAWDARIFHPLLVSLPVVLVWAASLPGLLPNQPGGMLLRRAGMSVLALGILALPAHRTWNLIHAAGREDARRAASAWMNTNAPAGSLVLVESYGPELTGRFNVLPVPFSSVSPHQFDIVYTPELYTTMDYVVLSSKMYDRYRGAPGEYPREVHFYELLPRGFELVKAFGSPQFAGPEIRIFRRREPSGLHDLSKIPRSFYESFKGHSQAAEFLSRLGALLARGGQDRLALHILQEALVMAPESPATWSNLGSVQLTGNRVDDALFSFRKARDLDPADARTHYNLGMLHRKNAEWSQAETELTRAITLDPAMEQGFLSLARVLIQAERYARARIVLREFMYRFPRSPKLAQAQAALAALRPMGPGKP